MRLSEANMQTAMGSHVAPYQSWLKRKYSTVDSHPISIHHKNHKSNATKRLSMEGLKRTLSGRSLKA